MLDVIILLSVAIILLSGYILSRPSKDEILYEAERVKMYKKCDKNIEDMRRRGEELQDITKRMNINTMLIGSTDLVVCKDEGINVGGEYCPAYILCSFDTKDKNWVIDGKRVKLIHRCYNLDDMENFVLGYTRALDDNVKQKKK